MAWYYKYKYVCDDCGAIHWYCPKDGCRRCGHKQLNEISTEPSNMGWASDYIEQLKEGKSIECRPRGNSMDPKIKSGQLCKIDPVTKDTELQKGDIVLCKVNGNQYLHLISAIKGNQYQISNNKKHVNGTVTRSSIFGKLKSVE
jgi:phage repressor protein C with HTH and peptisase S24 domain